MFFVFNFGFQGKILGDPAQKSAQAAPIRVSLVKAGFSTLRA
jgi:hypothetical protein